MKSEPKAFWADSLGGQRSLQTISLHFRSSLWYEGNIHKKNNSPEFIARSLGKELIGYCSSQTRKWQDCDKVVLMLLTRVLRMWSYHQKSQRILLVRFSLQDIAAVQKQGNREGNVPWTTSPLQAL